jgi:hypothetical protein
VLKSGDGPGTFATVMKRLFAGAFAAAILTMVLAIPVSAHGDHDARPLARQLGAGPYVISLWQVYPDAGTAMTPHLIVMFDGTAKAPAPAVVSVTVNTKPMEARPSTTTANAWETTDGIAEGDLVTVTITDGGQAWALDPVVVPQPPTSMLPMEELIYASIFLTIGTAWWLAGRTARAWRRPAAAAS